MWIEVKSSNLKQAAYSGTTRILYIVFNSRPMLAYAYKNVSAQRYKAFIDSENPGNYFIQHIKEGFEFSTIHKQKVRI